MYSSFEDFKKGVNLCEVHEHMHSFIFRSFSYHSKEKKDEEGNLVKPKDGMLIPHFEDHTCIMYTCIYIYT